MKNFYAYGMLLLTAWFMCTCMVQAQSQPGPQRYTNGIPAEISQHLSTANVKLESSPEESFSAARQGLMLAERRNHQRAAALARELMGKACEGLGDPVGAVIQYTLQVNTSGTNKTGIVEGRLNQASVFIAERNFDSALVALRDAERNLPSTKASELAARTRFLFGKMYYDQDDYKSSHRYYQSAGESYRALNDRNGLADCYLRMANCINFLGDYDEALELYRQSLDYFDKAGNANGVAKARGNMAGIFITQGKNPQAIEQYQRLAQDAAAAGDKRSLAVAHQGLGVAFLNMENLDRAAEELIVSLKLADELEFDRLKAFLYMNLGNIFTTMRQHLKAMDYYRQELRIRKKLDDQYGMAYTLYNIAVTQTRITDYKTAFEYHQQALEISERLDDPEGMNLNITALSRLMLREGRAQKALSYAHRAWALVKERHGAVQLAYTHDILAEVYSQLSMIDSAMYHYREELRIGKEMRSFSIMRNAAKGLAGNFVKQKMYDSAYVYADLHSVMQDSSYENDKNKEVAAAEARYQSEKKAREIDLLTKEKQLTELRILATQDSLRDIKQESDLATLQAGRAELENIAKQRELDYVTNLRKLERQRSAEEIARLETDQKLKQATIEQSKVLTYVVSGGLLLVLVAAIVAFVGYRGRKRAHERLQATQEQLLVQEKLASLGQLTAGIAHEIQNPLNFVNNFSDMTRELAIEAQEEIIDNGEMPTEAKLAELTALLGDIRNNSERVSGHGKRASAIVNQMLQHARTDSGEVSEVDLNKMLADMTELAYHGMRAQHKGMTIHVERNFTDEPLVIIAGAQELGRVVVNILNNAFDALIEHHEHHPEHTAEVQITTSRNGSHSEIRIRDNGPGIPDAIRDKIFQPFYTTKPTGKGTGLGLSLSYDIITQKYGGELTVESEPGKFTEFRISLPMKKS